MGLANYRHAYLFYSTSFIAPWALWFLAAYFSHVCPNEYVALISMSSFLGLLAPLIIAMLLIFPNRPLRQDLKGRIFSLQEVSTTDLSITFLLMPFSILTAQLISLFFGYSTEQFQFRSGYSFTSGVFPVWFILLIAPIVEELAWHSYGTDCLRNRFSLLKTSFLFALFWGIWHLPLNFIKDYYHSNLAESGLFYSIHFFVSLFPFVIIMNWLYYRANRSILIPIIFHISAGYFNEIFRTHPMSKVIQTGLLTLLAIFLIINDKTFFINLKTNSK